ncbi:MAG: four helix bundle protein [Crocinitomicaceae bacterium]|nr:four helix bundle protein [Crocinitomicaceae bacterium]
MKENLIAVKTFDFALDIVNFVIDFQYEKKEFVLSKQLLRAGTSIGANVAESEFAQSRSDFNHKMSISLKEANETRFWLRLFKHSKLNAECDDQLKNVDEIIKILVSIVNTSKSKMK